MMWFVIGTLCCVLWIACKFMSNHTRVHPPLPPGPLGLPIVGSLPFMGSELHSYLAELAKIYGPLVSLRIGNKIGIVVASSSMAKEVLKDFDVDFANHDVSAACWEASYGGFGIAWTPYSPKWKMLRKVCAREVMSPATLDATYNLRKHEIEQTVSYLEAQAGCLVNVRDRIFVMAMNMVTSTLWGGTLKGEERAKLGADFHQVVTEMTKLTGEANVSDVFPGLARFDLQGIAKKVRGCRKRLDDIFDVVIDRCRKMDKVEGCHKDFLQVMVELEDGSSSGVSKSTLFTMEQLKALFMDIVAGAGTITNTMEFAMAETVNKPEVMTRAQQELDTLLGSRNAPLEESHITRLPYIQAIMKETLRLHPILPLLIPHCPSQSCVVGGYTIPKDSRIFINVWNIHRDPSHWEDPLEFKPERFLDGRRYDFSGNDLSYLPFGSGRRNCAGIPMAERIVLYSLASLLHCFDWKLPQGVDRLDLNEKFGPTMKKRTPLFLTPSPKGSNLGETSSS